MKYILSALVWGCASFLMYAQTGTLKGRVTNAINNEPISFATVQLVGTTMGQTTDENGAYVIENVIAGVYDVRVSYVGFETKTATEIQITSNRPAVVDFALEEMTQKIEEVVIKASPFRKTEESPLSLRSIGITEIKRSPGGNRDISRVVQSLPGVTTTVAFRNDLIIRGGAPNENRFYLDDVEIPNINHFATQGASGGPVGLINVDFVKEVDFYSGAFPANRGNAASSVFNFRFQDGRDDRIGMTATLGANDLGFTLDGPIGDKTTFLLSARRSYLQFLFKALGLPFLPIYNDFQAKIKHKIDTKNEITFIGLGAVDNFALNLDANETEEQRYQLGFLPDFEQWNYTNGLVYKRYRDNGFTTFVISRNMLNNENTKYTNNDESSEDNLVLRYRSQEIENKLRIENTDRYGAYKLNYGITYEYVKYNNNTFSRIFTNAGAAQINYQSDINFHKYGAFGQVSRKWLEERLTLSVGTRFDGNSYASQMANPLRQFSPRASLNYIISPRWAVNANAGWYYQLPPYTVLGYRQNGQLFNKPTADYIRCGHTVAGIEYNTAANSKFTLEGYYKTYANYPFLLRDSISLANLGGDYDVVGDEPSVATSEGRSYGMEALFQQRLYAGWYGIAAYTLGWSEFKDKRGDFVPSSWDSRHIITLTAGKQFKKNWEVGMRWRYQSGLPLTPFSDASSLVSNWQLNGRALPDYNRINTLRQGASNQIDIRIDKKWFFKKWFLNLYLDVQNVAGSSVKTKDLILDVPLDSNGQPLSAPIIENPSAPADQQRYRLKTLQGSIGTRLPTIGLVVGI